ncbi:mechanosensitive ion channel family protein [uncultured Parasphingopyxis sp.]|uniref:mechanosensitive ion channel family protein n=1 Tax=uncultured Parasphingopyxis sp. TaxID=1547918 RepID=UPI0026082EE3|nr:mechanosensitive ion channel family protein [uncultured Parasphingopyxis sp.]
MTTTNTAGDAAISMPSSDALADFWTSTSEWVSNHYVELLIAAAGGLVVYLILEMMRHFGRRLRDRNPNETTLSSVVGQALWKTKHWFMLMVSAKIVTTFAESPERLDGVVTFLFTVTTVLQVAIWVREIILGFILIRAETDEDHAETLGTAMTLIRISVTVAVFAVALIVVLDNLGVDVTGLVAGLGVGGIAIGLAAQGIFEELFAALSIIFDKPFKKGDSIHYDNTFGTVEKIGLKTTRIRSVNGEEKIISNSLLLSKEISNNTQLERRRGIFNVGVIYQTPPDLAARIPEFLQEEVEKLGNTLARAGFTGFGASSLDYEVLFDVPSADYADFIKARHEVGIAIFRRFSEEGLEFAYPTQTTFTAAPSGEAIMPYPSGDGEGANPVVTGS